MKFKIKGRRASRNDQLMDWIYAVVKPGASVLDIGCGPKAYSTPLLSRASRVLTIDAWSWVEPDIVADLETTAIHAITQDRWDYVLMIDFIEHLDKTAGIRLLEDCKTITNKRIILLTPLPEIWTDNHEHVDDPRLWCHGNTYDLHKSSWSLTDFESWTRVELPSLKNYFFGYYET